MPENGRPEPTKLHTSPVMTWPNRDDVWNSVIDIIEFRSDKQTDDYVITATEVSYRTSPSLYHAISQAISQAKTPNYVAKYANQLCGDIAEAAVKLVQPNELQALIDHATNVEVAQ